MNNDPITLKLLSALKGLVENEDDIPSRQCEMGQHFGKAVGAIIEADPSWECPKDVMEEYFDFLIAETSP